MLEHPAIGGMRTAVNVENERILLLWVEVGRLLDPALNPLAVEARVTDFLRFRQIELRPQLPIEVGEASLRPIARNSEKVADHDRRGNQSDESAGVRIH